MAVNYTLVDLDPLRNSGRHMPVSIENLQLIGDINALAPLPKVVLHGLDLWRLSELRGRVVLGATKFIIW